MIPNIPLEIICQITLDMMNDPVTDPDSNTYERCAIVESLNRNQLYPITRSLISVNQYQIVHCVV